MILSAGGTTVWSWLDLMLGGLVVTIELAAASTAIVVVLSLLLAAAAISPWRALRIFSRVYCDLFRSIPILAMMLFVYFGLGPALGSVGISAFWMAVLAMSVVEAAYLAEVYRGALGAVPESQWSAAAALGLRWPRAAWTVILPQAFPAMIPSTANMVVYIVKDSALASLVTVNEVTLVASSIVATTFEPMQVYLVLAGVYLVLLVPLTVATHFIETRFAQ